MQASENYELSLEFHKSFPDDRQKDGGDMVKPIPDKYHSVTPSFTFKNSKKAIEFYKKAFGAELIDYLPNLDGTGTMHATVQIGNSIIMMGDEMPNAEKCSKSAETLGSSPISLYVYVTNVDEVYAQEVIGV